MKKILVSVPLRGSGDETSFFKRVTIWLLSICFRPLAGKW